MQVNEVGAERMDVDAAGAGARAGGADGEEQKDGGAAGDEEEEELSTRPREPTSQGKETH